MVTDKFKRLHCPTHLLCAACRGTDADSLRQREQWVRSGLVAARDFACPFGFDAARAAVEQKNAIVALCATQEQLKAVATHYRQHGTACGACGPPAPISGNGATSSPSGNSNGRGFGGRSKG